MNTACTGRLRPAARQPACITAGTNRRGSQTPHTQVSRLHAVTQDTSSPAPALHVPQTEIRIFSAKPYDIDAFNSANTHGHQLVPLDVRLNVDTVDLATRSDVVCVFVNDDVSAPVVQALADTETKCIALRCAGFNNVDLEACRAAGIRVVRVPAYSPHAIAEHTLALILGLNRNLHRAYNRVRDRNFSLKGLVGFDLKGKTVGVIGTGRIGAQVARLLWHFRCRVLCHDLREDEHLLELGCEYVDIDTLYKESQIISLNCPLLPSTFHMVNEDSIAKMRPGVMIVNTGRGALVDTAAVVQGLKTGQVGSVALDVYEEESALFFEDRSSEIIADDTFARLLTFPNVLMTAHQAFLTEDALSSIAGTTMDNITDVLLGRECANEVLPQ